MNMLTKGAFLARLAYATDQASFERTMKRSIRWAIEDRAKLPLPPVKNIELIGQEKVDEELTDNPIFIAVERASHAVGESLSMYEAMALAEKAWKHYQSLFTKKNDRESMRDVSRMLFPSWKKPEYAQ